MEDVVTASGIPLHCYGISVPSIRDADVAARPRTCRLHPLCSAAGRSSCLRTVVPVAPTVQDSSYRVRSCCSSGIGHPAALIQEGALQ